jgi:hypothetical protein
LRRQQSCQRVLVFRLFYRQHPRYAVDTGSLTRWVRDCVAEYDDVDPGIIEFTPATDAPRCAGVQFTASGFGYDQYCAHALFPKSAGDA